MSRAGFVIAVSATAACSRRTATPTRFVDLLDTPGDYVGRPLVVDVVERVRSDSGSGLLDIDLPEGEVAGHRIALEPGELEASMLVAPMRVRGTLKGRYPRNWLTHEDADPKSREWKASSYLLHVDAIAALPEPLPMVAPPAEVISAERRRWDRRLVVYEGEWTTGFETSRLDRIIWVDVSDHAIGGPYNHQRRPAGDSDKYRVRVTGRIYAHEGAEYGHLGQYAMELDATELQILEVLSPSTSGSPP